MHQRAAHGSILLGARSSLLALLGAMGPMACSDQDPAPQADRAAPEATDESTSRPLFKGGSGQIAEAGPGKWMKVDDVARRQLDDEQKAEIARLEAIGYAQGVRDAFGRGVTVHDEERAFQGLNLVLSGHAPEATLMDMNGEVRHRWSKDFFELFDEPERQGHPGTEFWRRAHLYPNGDLLAIYEGLGLVKLDRNSEVLWKSELDAHHDLDVLPDGSIYVLSRRIRPIPWVHPHRPVVEDFVSILSPEGEERKSVSILEAFRGSPFEKLVHSGPAEAGDIFHTNTLFVLQGRIAEQQSAFAKGRILTSMNNLGTIAVLDLDQESIVWCIQGTISGQHDPQILENGHLLFFDNQARPIDSEHPGRSRILEIDLGTGQPVWQFHGSDEAPFYSAFCGAVARLPNGNTLISESNGGRAFELTPEKEVVWEFYNPHRAGEEDEFIAQLLEVVRLDPDFPTDWLSP